MFLDAFFPLACLGCGAPDKWLCETCFRKITPSIPAPLARDPFDSPHSPLDGILAATDYRLPIVRKLIHTYKYRFIPDTGIPLAELLARTLLQSPLPLPDILSFVPLHPRRLRFRGFNQSQILAERLAPLLTPGAAIVPVLPTLTRTRHTKPQQKTRSREERLANLSGAFATLPDTKRQIRGKTLWLVDDVATTATTLTECAKVLKKAGAKRVYGIVVAK
ncbi:MAG: hypothetical protein A2808_00195 [Candidatus Moranbacteria bacterium RIFCSPHIGHO2_01_FULL_55_24]|nr:MAG: hypothetical protein A2808_00195 [Candidatus Moranbacteria bacterium RIFCSPHIGHO2_01_FULL_55_24]